mgnify:CR=1 FL=1
MSLLETCLLEMAKCPVKEGMLCGFPSHLTDPILDHVLKSMEKRPDLCLRLWKSLDLRIVSLNITDSVIDDRLVHLLNQFGSLREISFTRCIFDLKRKRPRSVLELKRLESLTFTKCQGIFLESRYPVKLSNGL